MSQDQPAPPEPAPLPSAIPGRPLLPVRSWRPLVTVTAFVAAVVCAAAAVAHLPLVIAAVGFLCVIAVVVGWVPLLGLPSPRGTTGVLSFAATALAVTGWLAAEEASGVADLRYVVVATAAGVLAACVHQLARRDGRPRLMESLSSEVAGVVLIAAWAGSLPYLTRPAAGGAVVVVGVAVAAAAFADIVRGRWVDDLPAVVIAALFAAVGAVVAADMVDVGRVPGWAVALAGMCAGVGAYALRQIFFVQPTQSRRRPQVASGAASMLLVGVVVTGLIAIS